MKLYLSSIVVSSVLASLPGACNAFISSSVPQRSGSVPTISKSKALPPMPSLSKSSPRIFKLAMSVDATTGIEIDLLEEADNIFDSIDANNDGKVTLEELRDHLVNQMGYSAEYTDFLFASFDMDSDGVITREEMRFSFYNFEALAMYMTFGVGGSMITSGNAIKKLVQKQGPGSHDKLLLDDLADLIFDLIDTDHSGEIDKEELKVHFESVTDKCSQGSTDTQANEYVQTMFDTLDANNDGVIQKEEMREAFQKYDFKLLAKTFGLRVYRNAEV